MSRNTYISSPICEICGDYKGFGSDHTACAAERKKFYAQENMKGRKRKPRSAVLTTKQADRLAYLFRD